MEITSTHIAALVALIGVIGGLLSLVKAFNTAIDAVKTQARSELDSLRREMFADMDRRDSNNSKARHDENNRVQQAFGKMDQDIERLKREGLRREDMQAIEQRFTALVGKVEGKIDILFEKMPQFHNIESRLEGLSAKLTDMAKVRA